MKKFIKTLITIFIFLWLWFIANISYASTNPFINQVETTSSGWIVASEEIMQTPVWSLVYFVIGMLIVSLLAWIVIGIIMWAKWHSWSKS